MRRHEVKEGKDLINTESEILVPRAKIKTFIFRGKMGKIIDHSIDEYEQYYKVEYDGNYYITDGVHQRRATYQTTFNANDETFKHLKRYLSSELGYYVEGENRNY